MKALYTITLTRTFLISIIASITIAMHALTRQPAFTVEEIMAENGHIKDVLKIAAMIKECMGSAKTYRALADCMAARVGYTQNAPLDLEADKAYAQSQIRLLNTQCIRPLQLALNHENELAAPLLQGRITECQEAVKAFRAFLDKNYTQP